MSGVDVFGLYNIAPQKTKRHTGAAMTDWAAAPIGQFIERFVLFLLCPVEGSVRIRIEACPLRVTAESVQSAAAASDPGSTVTAWFNGP
jgi:hypothetical protein